MTYQGARARPEPSEVKRVFNVSKIRLSQSGSITEVLWSEVNTKSNLDVSTRVVVPVADVVDAIHDGAQIVAIMPAHRALPYECVFEVIEHADGSETIALFRHSDPHVLLQLDLHQMEMLDS